MNCALKCKLAGAFIGAVATLGAGSYLGNAHIAAKIGACVIRDPLQTYDCLTLAQDMALAYNAAILLATIAASAFGWRQAGRHALKRSNPPDAAPPTGPSA